MWSRPGRRHHRAEELLETPVNSILLLLCGRRHHRAEELLETIPGAVQFLVGRRHHRAEELLETCALVAIIMTSLVADTTEQKSS